MRDDLRTELLEIWQVLQRHVVNLFGLHFDLFDALLALDDL